MDIKKIFMTIPDGAFPLQEVLAAPTTKEFIKTLRVDSRSTVRKLKIFLSFYQTFDMLGQLQERGVDTSTVDMEEISMVAGLLIEANFGMIIKSFEKKDRALLNALFNESSYTH